MFYKIISKILTQTEVCKKSLQLFFFFFFVIMALIRLLLSSTNILEISAETFVNRIKKVILRFKSTLNIKMQNLSQN